MNVGPLKAFSEIVYGSIPFSIETAAATARKPLYTRAWSTLILSCFRLQSRFTKLVLVKQTSSIHMIFRPSAIAVSRSLMSYWRFSSKVSQVLTGILFSCFTAFRLIPCLPYRRLSPDGVSLLFGYCLQNRAVLSFSEYAAHFLSVSLFVRNSIWLSFSR